MSQVVRAIEAHNSCEESRQLRNQNMSDDAEKAMQDLSDVSDRFNSVMKLIEQEQEEYWNSLTKEQQLAAFCAVSRRIHQGELVDQGSYRHVLYGVFGWGPEAYAPAQLAGYLEIHNAIRDSNDDRRLL